MSKLKKSILFYFSIIVFSIIIHSCCPETTVEITGVGELSVSHTPGQRSDTLTRAFSLFLRLDTDIVQNTLSEGLIPTAYGSTCIYNHVNMIIPESIELSLDKDFVYDDQVIPAETNFFDSDIISTDIADSSSSIEIFIDQEYLDNAIISKGDYTFKVSVETTDDLYLTNTVSTYLNIH